MRALIVEDDATIADFVAKGLREAGFAVEVASDGEAAFGRATGDTFDVAIVDVMLPRLDGLGLIDAMRMRGVRTPVPILSAKRSVDDRVRGLQAGLSIGIYNSARVLNGLQLGVLNRAQNNRGIWRMLPLVNAHF